LEDQKDQRAHTFVFLIFTSPWNDETTDCLLIVRQEMVKIKAKTPKMTKITEKEPSLTPFFVEGKPNTTRWTGSDASGKRGKYNTGVSLQNTAQLPGTQRTHN